MSTHDTPTATLLCLSHLAWESGLFQRPQQLMSRLAARGFRVLYVGCVGWKKCYSLGQACGLSGIYEDVHYLHLPYSPQAPRTEWLRRRFTVHRIASELTDTPANTPLVTWFYHPALLPLAESFTPTLTIYDVMDRFENFAAHAGPLPAEAHLLEKADLVFTGGRSLQEATRRKLSELGGDLPEPICLPSGVDLDHFAAAQAPEPLPSDIAQLPRPLLGYFGAIDERMDFELIRRLGQAFPSASIVLIGPPLISVPSDLPPNVHLLGARDYAILPDYLRGFSVCLLPFRQSSLVAHISPTKTPEYLAGGKPVVSTAIPDVYAEYGDIVAVASTGEEFIQACAQAIASPPDTQALVAAAHRARTWDQLADQMAHHLKDVLRG